MTGKEYMNRIRLIRREIRLLEEQILRDTVFASNVKAIRYDIDKIQTSPVGDRMADIISGIVNATDELHERIKLLQEKESEARTYLLQLREEHERVLILHYLDGYKWDVVADKMNYSEKYIYDIKDKALAELTEVLKESEQF